MFAKPVPQNEQNFMVDSGAEFMLVLPAYILDSFGKSCMLAFIQRFP